jgi:hypothetical protein
MAVIREAYPHAAASAAALLRDPAVAASWDGPSALPEFRVSGLAGHLAWQVLSVAQALAEPVADRQPRSLLDHYAGVRWLGADVNDEANVGIRRDGEELAAGGAARLAAQTQAATDEVREALRAEPGDRVVGIPWLPWSLRLDDFLTTRMMEIAVHSDDLAVSAGIPTPALPPTVLEPVFELLSRLAVNRHGPTALLRALSRAERAPATIAAL